MVRQGYQVIPEIRVSQSKDKTVIEIRHSTPISNLYLAALLLDFSLKMLNRELGVEIDNDANPTTHSL
jgi:hypothetical protein